MLGGWRKLHNEELHNVYSSINLIRIRRDGQVYLGTTVTNQNLIQEEIKRRLNSGNVCYHSVQSLLSSRLLSKNLKIRIYKVRQANFLF
jgi:hypothetical protein